MEGRRPLFYPCTPLACLQLISLVAPDLTGLKASVIGRSTIVGLPLALMLSNHNATVCMLNGSTPVGVLRQTLQQSDLVIAACGVPKLVRGEMVQEGAILIDVGINYVEGEDRDSQILVGDIAYEEAVNKARAITPVPGGVGPMTIAMLLENVVQAWKN